MSSATAVVTEENRDLIYKARMLYEKLNGKKEEVQHSYQENIVDTGISEDIEKKIDAQAKATKTAISIVGTVATVVLMFCPVDGPFGEALTLLATPAFCALVNVATDIRKKMLISGKRGFEKYFMKAEGGQNPQVSGYNLDNNEVIDDFVQFAENIGEITKGV